MIKKYLFKEKMTGRKKCPVCGQREIPLSEDFCEVCRGEIKPETKIVESQKKAEIMGQKVKHEIYSGTRNSFLILGSIFGILLVIGLVTLWVDASSRNKDLLEIGNSPLVSSLNQSLPGLGAGNNYENNGSLSDNTQSSKDEFYRTFKIRPLLSNADIYELKISIPSGRYNYYINNELGHKFDVSKNIALWATPDDPIIGSIAEELRALENKDRNFQFINSVFEIVRSIEYVSDYEKDKSGEYWKFPIETLAEGKGDCEDMSFLAAGLFSAIGWDVILAKLPGHMAMAIEVPDVVMKSLYNTDYIPFDYYSYNNRKYYYVETTNLNDFKLADIPQEYKNKIPTFYSVASKKQITEKSGLSFVTTPDWKIFVSAEDNFKMLLPLVPEKKTMYYRTARYESYTGCTAEPLLCYKISVHGNKNDNNFTPSLKQESELVVLDDYFDFEILSIKEINFDGYTAYDSILRAKNFDNDSSVVGVPHTIIRHIYVGGMYYELRVFYFNNECEENNCNQFFETFQLLN